MPQKSILLQAVHNKARLKRLSPRTERVYRSWILRFIRYHGLRHPRELGPTEVADFLTHLATERKVAASTQTQALCALVFLFQTVLGRPLGRLAEMTWAQSRHRLPVVLTAAEVSAVVGRASSTSSGMPGRSTTAILRRVRGRSSCRLRWAGSTPTRGASGPGSGYSRRPGPTGTGRRGRRHHLHESAV